MCDIVELIGQCSRVIIPGEMFFKHFPFHKQKNKKKSNKNNSRHEYCDKDGNINKTNGVVLFVNQFESFIFTYPILVS